MIPDFVLDYCVYHELCHLMIGFDPMAKRHGEWVSKLEAELLSMSGNKENVKYDLVTNYDDLMKLIMES